MRLIRQTFLTPIFYCAICAVILLFVMSGAHAGFFMLGQIALVTFVLFLAIDLWLLYGSDAGVLAEREMADKFSNGDHNPVVITIRNQYPFALSGEVIDEMPVEFQRRDTSWPLQLEKEEHRRITYQLRPVQRGAYTFGRTLIFVQSPLRFVSRRFAFGGTREVAVYPSFMHLKKYAFAAFDKRLNPFGIKKIRQIGHTMEFEQIREYVAGDDTRTLNWKASARHNALMINQYQDERAQPVYMAIDKGRLMQMPFDGMSLLDFAINASLVLSYIAIQKEDKAGLVTFAQKVDTVLPARKRNAQMQMLVEHLYKQRTDYMDSDFRNLYSVLLRKIPQRSLLLLFTNFETVSSFRRQLQYLKALAKKHLVVVIFFRNTGLNAMIERKAGNVREIYYQTLAEKFLFEKETIVRILRQNGIHCILTTPADLTINTINKYLELKARAMA